MILGVGIDVCSIARFEAMSLRHPGAVAKVLTEAERRLPISSQAARFAAKEALAKALGVPDGLAWLDCEIPGHGDKPEFVTKNTVALALQERCIQSVNVSLSHDAGIATALVVLDG